VINTHSLIPSSFHPLPSGLEVPDEENLFFMYIAFECCPLGIVKVVEFVDKNYPKTRLRGVFSHKVHEAQSAKAFKRVL